MSSGTLRWILPVVVGLVVGLFTLTSGPAPLFAAAATAKDISLPAPYGAIYSDWTAGYWFWRIIYTMLSIAAVSLPALIAAGVPRQESRRQTLSAIAAATVAVATFMQAGVKATAHEHAYVCMQLADAAYRTGLNTPAQLQARTEACAAYIDYDYLDAGGATAKHDDQGNRN